MRQLPEFQAAKKSTESCHVSGCHVFFGPNLGESMKTAINAAFSGNSGYSSVSYVTVHRVGSTTAQTLPTASDSDDELPVVWIIVAVVTGHQKRSIYLSLQRRKTTQT